MYVDTGSARVNLGENDNIILTFNNTGLYCNNNSLTVLASANDYTNDWHHYKVEFECGSGYNYNLAQDEYRISLDNESQGEYLIKSGTSAITQFGFNTWTTNDTTFYADAIGFSWDANYTIGENYNCGNVTDFYAYSSTKLDGFSPCLMNLPSDALELIAWIRDYENSDQGKKPQNFDAYLEQWWASVWDEAQEAFQNAIDAMVLFFVENFPWAWLLIRAAILLMIYITLAGIILSLTIMIATLALILLPISLLTGGSISYNINKLECEFFEKSMKAKYQVKYDYNNYL